MAPIVINSLPGNIPKAMISWTDDYLWVVNQGNNTVSQITYSPTLSIIRTILVGNNPSGIADNGTYVWVGNFDDNNITKIEISTGNTITLPATIPSPTGIRARFGYLWVTSVNTGNLYQLDISTGNILNTISLGNNPFSISTSTDNGEDYIWVTNVGNNNISRITVSDLSITLIPVGSLTGGISLFDGVYLWVSNININSVSRIKTDDLTYLTFSIPSTPGGISSDGLSYVWVVSTNSNNVYQIDISSGNILNTIAVGTAPNYGVRAEFVEGYVFVSNPTNNRIYQIQVNNPICYSKGTIILCNTGYVPIEDLKPGDLVKTYLHGDREIEVIGKGTMFNNPNKWSECMYRLPSMNDEFDDLIVTGGHGILKRTLTSSEIDADPVWFKKNGKFSKIDNLYLQRAAFSKEFHQITTNERYTYYHFSLKGPKWKRYGVWANGVLSESTFSECISKNLKLKY
jgi:streptogramin lyase